MDFTTAVKTVFRRYNDFKGRSARPEYWWFFLFSFIVNLIVEAIAQADATLGGIGNLIVFLAFIVPSLAVTFRRLHDIDRSAWWILITLVPIVGWIALIYWFCQRGTPGPNRFGPDPAGGYQPDAQMA